MNEEIEEEAAEHQFFFAFTEGAFTNPTGNGNIDNASDPIVYNDTDGNGIQLDLIPHGQPQVQVQEHLLFSYSISLT